jgi:carboxymethylenebutenolidase
MPDVKSEHIVCPGGLPAFIAFPVSPAGDKVPVMVLLHERYGLVQHTKNLAMRHAHDGFLCIAADYFYKHPDQHALHSGDAGYDMTDPEAVEYLNAAIDTALCYPQADASRIAVMGVCQTGRHPLVIATERPIAAALVWYGAAQDREWQVNARYPVSLDTLIAKTPCPILAMFGEADHIISIDHIRRLRASLEAHGKSFEIEVHHGAPHGWLNDTMPGRYRREQAEAAWATQRAFLARVLTPNTNGPIVTQRYSAAISPTYDFSKNVRHE